MKPKIILFLGIFFSVVKIYSSSTKYIGKVVHYEVQKSSAIFHCEGGEVVSLEFLSNDIIRLRMAEKGFFSTSLPVKFGFVKDKLDKIEIASEKKENKLILSTNKINVEVSLSPFRLALFDTSHHLIFSQYSKFPVKYGDSLLLSFNKFRDEHYYGFGFMRETFDAQGLKLRWKRDYRWNEATVPFFMSTQGYGFYSNNAFNSCFDFTKQSTENDCYSFSSEAGQVDLFIFYGPDFKHILDSYTRITGKPKMIPAWALSIEYRCRYYTNQSEALKIAATFRMEDIPISILALEPGWENKPYQNEYKWSKERYPDPIGMIKNLKTMGFRLDLWESGSAPKKEFTLEEIRNQWFEQRKHLLDEGVRMFKVDDPYPRQISSIELQDAIVNKTVENSEKYNPKELVNLINSLYTETVFKQFTKYTGERAVLMNHAYAASIASQRWPFQWGGDFKIGNGILSAGMSGHSIVSFDIDDFRNSPYELYASRIHAGYLIPFPVINSWCDYSEPWLFPKPVEDMHRFYAKLRSRLNPYIYTTQYQSVSAAIPMLRPMVLSFQSDNNTYHITSQYMLGDWLLVGLPNDKNQYQNRLKKFKENAEVFPRIEQTTDTTKIYLPQGVWFDFWNGKKYLSKGEWLISKWPDYVGGPLFVKGGAIIPEGQVTSFIGEEPLEVVQLEVFPDKHSSYTLFEDDGHTYQYEKGEFSTTDFTCSEFSNGLDIYAGRRKGTFANIPQNRSFLMKVHVQHKPKIVKREDDLLPELSTKDSLLHNYNVGGWFYDDVNSVLYIKTSKSWFYNYDSRGPCKDMDRDKVFWIDTLVHEEGDFHIKIFDEENLTSNNNLFKYRLLVKANPPAIVKLDDGSWMDGQVNIFVNIIDSSGSIVDTDIPIRLHITGESESLPSDRVVNTKNGMAIFRDVFYKKPAKYVFHITGDGIESYDLPIY